MSKEVLTHSEAYVKKTNRIILTVGITSLLIFLGGLYLLYGNTRNPNEYVEPVLTGNDDALNFGRANPLDNNIEFSPLEDEEVPITLTDGAGCAGQYGR